MLRSVVTGGAGFLGSHLVDMLLARGHRVVIADNLSTGMRENIAHLERDPRVIFLLHDVAEPFTVGGPVDFVYHFASPASPDDFKRIPLEVLRAGSYATHNALDLADKKNARFMLASTSEVYGDPTVSPQPETYRGNVNPVGPRGCYDEAKRYAEAATVTYRDALGVETRIVRFFNTFGPRMRPDDGRVVPNFIAQALANKPLTIYGDGLQTRSFGFFSDILDGAVRLMESDYREPVNIGTQEEHTMLEFARIVLEVTGSSSDIVHLPAPIDDPRIRRPDITRARTILSWEPTTSLREGLRQTVDDLKARITL